MGSSAFSKESRQILAYMWMNTVFMILTSIPWSLYTDFVIEEKLGFNKKTMRIFITDLIKNLVISGIMMSLMPLLITKMIVWGGMYFPIYVTLTLCVFQLVWTVISPILITPCFNKEEPLEDGPLKTKIEELASKHKFPLSKLFKIDNSTRSTHSNAYLYGFCSKRIVLFDTLIEKCSPDEIVAILGHELGHWYHMHTWIGLAVFQLYMLTLMSLFQLCMQNTNIIRSFGYSTPCVFISFQLFSYMLGPLMSLITFAMNKLSRANEFQADRFAVNKCGSGENLIAGLMKIMKENKGVLNCDPLYSAYHHTHPPPVERLQAIQDGIDAKTRSKKDQ